MPQTKVLGVTIVESKALTKLLKVRMVINQTQSHQRIQQLEKRDCNCTKICTPQRWPLIFFFFFFEYLPLFSGVSQNSVVESDPSLSTAHLESQTNTAEFCGSNPMPVTVMVWPPPKLPESKKTE